MFLSPNPAVNELKQEQASLKEKLEKRRLERSNLKTVDKTTVLSGRSR